MPISNRYAAVAAKAKRIAADHYVEDQASPRRELLVKQIINACLDEALRQAEATSEMFDALGDGEAT